MKYRNIPRTDLSVSSFCLGGAHFGTGISAEKAMELMDCFKDIGGNFIDTANVYGKWSLEGRSASEEVLGMWIRQRKNRDSIVLTTKGAHPFLSSMNVQRLSREEISADLDDSLKNLGVDYIDLYWLHRDDPNRSVDEIIETLETFVKDGRIRYYSCSNWRVSRINAACEYAGKHNITGFVADQMMWSLAEPNKEAMFDPNMVSMDAELKGFHEKTSMAAIPYSSQANGYFSWIEGSDRREPPKDVLAKYDNSINRARYERVKELSARSGASIPGVILAYLINQPFTVIPAAGFDSKQQMKELLKDSDLILTPEDIKYLEAREDE